MVPQQFDVSKIILEDKPNKNEKARVNWLIKPLLPRGMRYGRRECKMAPRGNSPLRVAMPLNYKVDVHLQLLLQCFS